MQKKAITYNQIIENKSHNCRLHKNKFLLTNSDKKIITECILEEIKLFVVFKAK